MKNLSFLNISVILIYLLSMLVIGFVFKNKVKKTSDYYLAGRSLGVFVILATVCASIIGGGAMIGRGGITYSQGMVAILLGLPYLIGMYIFSLISGRIQRVGKAFSISSIPELMEFRFGKKVKYLSAAIIAFTMMATVGTQITATATILKTIGGFSYEAGAWIAALIFISYTVFSGLYGVVYTDVVQFVILILFMYILLPVLSLVKVGGIQQLVHSVPAEMLSIHITPQLAGWIFTSLIFTLAGAEMWQRAFAAKNSQTAVRGMLIGNTVYAYTILITVIIGLSASILLPHVVRDYGSPDAAIPVLIVTILPNGVAGLTMAGLLAVLMSSADTYLLLSVQTLQKDIICSAFPKMDDKRDLFYTRVCTIFLGLSAVVIALYIRQAYKALMFAWTFHAASIGIPAIAALYWKKTTTAGIISAIITGFTTSLIWKFAGTPFGLSSSIPGATLCGLVLVAVSLATYKNNPSEFPHLSESAKLSGNLDNIALSDY